jgi:hypothetical protein
VESKIFDLLEVGWLKKTSSRNSAWKPFGFRPLQAFTSLSPSSPDF